jgi:hypothetical protein
MRGLRVSGSLHVSTRHRIQDKWGRDLPRSGALVEVIPLRPACLILIMSEIDYNGVAEGLRGGVLAERQGD